MWCGEAFYGVGVQVVEVLILLGALFLSSVPPESQQDFFLFYTMTSFFFWWDWDLNSWLHTCKAGLSHTSSPFFCGYFGVGIWRAICPG
jgi:hypothetical protein